MANMERDVTRRTNGTCYGGSYVVIFSSFRSGFKVFFRTTT